MDALAERSEVYDGLQIERQAAPVVRRIVAYLIDLGIVYAVVYFSIIIVVLAVIAVVGTGTALEIFTKAGDGASIFTKVGLIAISIVLVLFVFGVYHGYFIYYEYKKGATPGKRIFGLSVVSTEGAKLRVGQCVLRDFLRYIDCMLIFPGLISISATQRKQRLGDLAASTLVVYSSRKERRREYVYVAQDEYQYLSELLQPRSVEPANCKKYLAFAYPRFVRRVGGAVNDSLESEWETFAHHYLPEAKERALDRQTTLLFFAELCSQTINPSTKG